MGLVGTQTADGKSEATDLSARAEAIATEGQDVFRVTRVGVRRQWWGFPRDGVVDAGLVDNHERPRSALFLSKACDEVREVRRVSALVPTGLRFFVRACVRACVRASVLEGVMRKDFETKAKAKKVSAGRSAKRKKEKTQGGKRREC